MTIIQCRACKEAINSRERVCPFCGVEKPGRREGGAISGVALFAIALLLIAVVSVVAFG